MNTKMPFIIGAVSGVAASLATKGIDSTPAAIALAVVVGVLIGLLGRFAFRSKD